MSQTILLTGITGFIAKRLALDLLNKGYAVRGSLRSARREDEVRAALRPMLDDEAALDRLSFVALDLTSDDGWDAAMEGVDALMHTASPFPMAQPKNPDDLIRPAVDGTLRALRAAQKAGVTRVVLTSSMVAIMHDPGASGPRRDESNWTDPDAPTATPYDASKTLAERAAWDFVAAHPEMQLTTINPGLVTGVPLDAHFGTSLELVQRSLSGKDPAVPNFGLPIVDVADVAAMHIAALEKPQTAGKRYIASAGYMMFPEINAVLKGAFPDARITTRVAPKWLLRILSLFDPTVKTVLPSLDIRLDIDNARAREDMGIAFIPVAETLKQTGAYLRAA